MKCSCSSPMSHSLVHHPRADFWKSWVNCRINSASCDQSTLWETRALQIPKDGVRGSHVALGIRRFDIPLKPMRQTGYTTYNNQSGPHYIVHIRWMPNRLFRVYRQRKPTWHTLKRQESRPIVYMQVMCMTEWITGFGLLAPPIQ